jgi:hypothetical protein
MNLSEDRGPRILRTLQIIHSAIFAGPVIFLGIIAYLFVQQGKGLAPPENLPPLTLAALAFMAAAVPISFLLPRMFLRSAMGRIAAGTWQAPGYEDGREMPGPWSDADKLMVSRQTANIIGLALLEGAVFFACIALMIEGQVLALIAAAVGLLLMLTQFPTQGRIRAWLDEQADRLAQLRQENQPAASRR